MYDTVIRNGLVVTHDSTIEADIAIKNGKILSIGARGSLKAGKTELNATGKVIMPGLIDPHVHIKHPFKDTFSQDDFYTATIAAARGGTTTIIDFAIQWDKKLNLAETVALRKKQAGGQVVIDYALHACPTKSSMDTVKELPKIVELGIPSFKLYMIYRKQGRMTDDGIIFRALEEVKNGGIVGVHAENSAIAEFSEEDYLNRGLSSPAAFPMVKPNIVEAEAINRVLYLNKCAQGNLYIFHLSTAEGLEMVAEARGKGQSVTAETCTHYLVLTEDYYKRSDGANFICSPPLRSYDDVDALWKGVANGTIDVIGSDHCGFGKEQKALGNGDFSKTPNGLPGIELRLPVIYTEGVLKKRISINRMVEALSTNPAKIFGLYPKKGAILPGSDADLAIVDLNEEREIITSNLSGSVDWSPYEGMHLRGFAETVISRGEIIVNNGVFKGKRGRGKFLERKL